MKHHQRTLGKNDEWLTPPEIMERLGSFDLDPCAATAPGRRWARTNISKSCDGLAVSSWCVEFECSTTRSRVWLNPPFNRYERPKWMKKMAEHGNGIMLIPAATETKAFFDYVWTKANAVCFVKGRPHFHYRDGKRASFNCGTAIALVAYGTENVEALVRSNLGKVVIVNQPVSKAEGTPQLSAS